ncbi:MAG: GGDEF domain-containing protein [Pseudomonadota bacterium]
MKVGDAKASTPLRTVGGASPARAANAYAKAAPPQAPADAVSVMGIPEHEMTPKVRDAIMKLMEEVGRLRQDLSRTRERVGELEALADKDPLLHVYNRRAFVRELSRVLSFAERYDAAASLIYIDLDNFKEVNDTHGHAAGDAVLEHVAGLLAANVRESDAVGRLGGDEFGVILASAGGEAAERKAQSLADLVVATPVPWKDAEIPIAASFGAFSLKSGQSVTEALESADKAMYAKKRQRKEQSSGEE